MFKHYAFQTALILLLAFPFTPTIPLEMISDMQYIASSSKGSGSRRSSARSSSRRSQQRASHRTSSQRVRHGQGGTTIRRGSSQGGTKYIYRYHQQPQTETPTYIYRYHEQPLEEEEPTYVYQNQFEPEEEVQEEPQVYAQMAPETPPEETPSDTAPPTQEIWPPREVGRKTDTRLVIEHPEKMTEVQKKKLSTTLNLDMNKVPVNVMNAISEYCRKKYWDDKEKDPLIRQINHFLVISCFGELGNSYIRMKEKQAPSPEPEPSPEPSQAPTGPETPTD